MFQQETAPPRRPLYTRPWLWIAAAAVVVAAVVAGALLLTHGGSSPSPGSPSSLSFADRQACDTLDRYGLSAAGGDQDAAERLYVDFQDAAGSGVSPNLAPYAQIVDGSAQVVATGGDSPRFSEYVGQMRGVCETLGWRAGS